MLVSQVESRSNFRKSVREIYYFDEEGGDWRVRCPDETDGVCRTESEDLTQWRAQLRSGPE